MKERKAFPGVTFLREAGLNLIAVLNCAGLPESIATPMLSSGVSLADYQRLVLLGHGGRRLWAALQAWGMQTADPVDYYRTQIARQFIRAWPGNPPVFSGYIPKRVTWKKITRKASSG